MKQERKVSMPLGIVGVAIHAPMRADQRSLEEAQYAVVQGALSDASLTMSDIDGIVVAGNDQLDGRAITLMAASGSVGGVGREILSTPSAAEHAFVLASLRIRAGQGRTQLVVAWSPIEVSSTSEALHLGTDPYFHRALPLNDLTAAGLQATTLEAAVPQLRAAAHSIVRKNREHGAIAYPDRALAPTEEAWIAGGRIVHWPLSDTMRRPHEFGLTAIVVMDDRSIAERGAQHVAWVRGIGWATEPSFIGDRNLAQLPSLAAAARQAFTSAAIDAPETAFDVAEVDDSTPYQELLAYEGLGFCRRAEWTRRVADGTFGRNGRLPVNLSGGACTFNPFYCAGLVRIAEAANQVRGRAGKHQRPGARLAVAHAASGFAMQYNTVVVMGSEQRGETG